MLKFVSKNALLLGLAAVACVAVIAGVNQLTAATIAQQAQAQKLKVLKEVLPPNHQDDALLDHCLEVIQALGSSRRIGTMPAQAVETWPLGRRQQAG